MCHCPWSGRRAEILPDISELNLNLKNSFSSPVPRFHEDCSSGWPSLRSQLWKLPTSWGFKPSTTVRLGALLHSRGIP
jgi:hypothetical protein